MLPEATAATTLSDASVEAKAQHAISRTDECMNVSLLRGDPEEKKKKKKKKKKELHPKYKHCEEPRKVPKNLAKLATKCPE